jgi:hypothetical protein
MPKICNEGIAMYLKDILMVDIDTKVFECFFSAFGCNYSVLHCIWSVFQYISMHL